MSRIGKLPVPVPVGCGRDASSGTVVTVNGPKGTLAHRVAAPITIDAAATGVSTSSVPTTSAEQAACTG